MNRAELKQIIGGLKGFQQDAVEHIVNRLYRDPKASGRFLVADETGLGKSVIARGVVASAIAELQEADHIKRIDIVYICSSLDLAKQNLRRLNVTGDPHIGISSRLTLLALESHQLTAPHSHAERGTTGTTAPIKKVNLVSFTPGTSFEMGWQTGSQRERQLLHILLNGMTVTDAVTERASALFFQGTVHSLANFEQRISAMRALELPDGPDAVILDEFNSAIDSKNLRADFEAVRDSLCNLDRAPTELRPEITRITSALRGALAQASARSLEPDLVILDEFQRFKHLIDPESGSAASELAHRLFEDRDAKVLLLSATPYKPFTTVASDSDDDHYEDFMTTLRFLANGDEPTLTRIRSGFRNYRNALITGADAGDEATKLQSALLPLMSRSERPPLTEGRDLKVRRVVSEVPTPDDLSGYAALQAFAREIDSPVSLDYWKSIPYFASYMEGYRPGERARQQLRSGEATPQLRAQIDRLHGVDPQAITQYEHVDYGNARLRTFAAETIEQEWWKLLWMPPSMPYLQPGAVYAPFANGSVTKRLIFSAWSGVPTSVASLLSYEAERRMVEGSSLTENTADARKSVSARLDYVMRDDKPAGMSTLALFWPHPQLAALGDPLRVPRKFPDSGSEQIPDAGSARTHVDEVLRDHGATADEQTPEATWEAFFAWPGAWPEGVHRRSDAAAYFLAGRGGSGNDSELAEGGRGLRAHAKVALDQGGAGNGTGPTHWHPDLAVLALHSPGNIAYRALARLCEDSDFADDTLAAELWRAAARLANGIRSLFNRMDVIFLIDKLYGEQPYWRSVLDYCADGNLQAVLDEYCFQLKFEFAGKRVDADVLRQITDRAIEALTLRTSRYVAQATDAELTRIPITVRFALRYGGAGNESENPRQPEVRNAFNSPFWPFVLATTSVGQEGIDFHWWSHSVVHWNLPSNPVDFEQREGRVNRFGGHAVRKNVATTHGAGAMASRGAGLGAGTGGGFCRSPWEHAFEAAKGDHPELGDFSPWWIYPGDARVERMLVHFPLSREDAKYKQLSESLALYRLTLGQPRQEDMLELLRSLGVSEGGVAKLDLRPPARTRAEPC